MALTKVTGQVIKNTTDVTVGVLTVTNTLAVGGTVSIGGTLTYEDVTNVDAVGLITARNGIVVGSGITLSKDGDVFFTGIATGNGSGLTALNASNISSGTVPTARLGSGTASSSTFLRGDSSFQTVNTDLVSDTSPQLGGNLDVNSKAINFGDSNGSTTNLVQFGAGTDLRIYHEDGVGNVINSYTSNAFKIFTNGNTEILTNNSETCAKFVKNGAVELYYDNSKKLETTNIGVTISGDLKLPDNEELRLGDGNDLQLYHNGSNSYVDSNTGNLYVRGSGGQILLRANSSEDGLIVKPDGAVELYHDNTKRLETNGSGVVIPSGANNCLRVFGSNAAHATSALIIGQNNSTTSQLRAYGPDSSTNGRIEFRSSRSDATNTVNLIYDSGNLEFASGNGISFAATGDGSGTMSSELLDDYEEGTFTPTVESIASPNYTVQAGRYTKIGNLVTAQAYLLMASGGGEGNTFKIASLPFTSISSNYREGGGYIIYENGFFDNSSTPSAKNTCTVWVPANNTKIHFHKRYNGAAIYGNDTSFGTGANNVYLVVQVCYQAA